MHQLIILRHAKAAPQTPGGADHERRLTIEGRQAAAKMGGDMRRAGLTPDVVLVSSAARTLETLETLEDAGLWDERPNIDTLPALYMAPASRIRDLLRELPETVRSALVIGHNPGLHELAQSLAMVAGQQPDVSRLMGAFPTAGLAEFLVTAAWHKLGPESARLQRFVEPGSLKSA